MNLRLLDVLIGQDDVVIPEILMVVFFVRRYLSVHVIKIINRVVRAACTCDMHSFVLAQRLQRQWG